MKRLTPVVILAAVLVLGVQQSQGAGSERKSGFTVKLPIPDFDIPCDLSLWRGNLQIVKMSYNEDDGRVVFVVKALRNFSFTDDGFENIQFLDEDGVDLVDKKNLKFMPSIKDLKKGESTRAELDVPDNETLKKTKNARAAAKGFFSKGKSNQ